MTIEEKADFMRRFKASRERKAEYIAQMEKRMRDDYRRRTGKEAESFYKRFRMRCSQCASRQTIAILLRKQSSAAPCGHRLR